MTYLYSLFFFERSFPFLFSNSFGEMPNTCLRSMLIWIIDGGFIMLSLHNLVFFISLDNCSLASCKIISALLISSLVFAVSFLIWDKFSLAVYFPQSLLSSGIFLFQFSPCTHVLLQDQHYIFEMNFSDTKSFGIIFSLVGPPTLNKWSLTNLSATMVSSLDSHVLKEVY